MNYSLSITQILDSVGQQKKIKLWILLVLFIFASAWLSVGWLQPDEHARVMEPAHFLVYGYATLPWELSATNPLVSYLLAFFHTPILFVTKSLSLSGLHEAVLLRFFAGIICSSKILAMAWILKAFNFKGNTLVAMVLLFALGPYGPVMLIRTSQENYGVTMLMWSVAFFLKYRDQKSAVYSFFWSGFFLALAVSFRLQIGITAFFLGLYIAKFLLDIRAVYFVVGCLAGFLPLAAADYVTFGEPFLPAWNYFKYALSDEDGGGAWGTEEWYWYFKEYFSTWFPPLSPLLLLFILSGLKRAFLLQLLIIPYVIIHMMLGHKEMRYMAPILPWVFVATGIGFYEFRYKGLLFFEFFKNKVHTSQLFRRTLYGLLAIYFFIGLGGALITLNSSPKMYDKIGNLYRAGEAPKGFLYIGNTASGVSEFYTKVEHLPFRQISTDDYLALLRQKKWDDRAPSLHAFYALHSEELVEAEKSCELYYFAGFEWVRKFFDRLPDGIKKPRYHGILRCPSGV